MGEQTPPTPSPQVPNLAAAAALGKLLNATPQVWAMRGCLFLLFISVFLPWYSIDSRLGGESFAIIHSGLGVLILLLALGSLAFSLLIDMQLLKLPLQGLMVPGATALTLLFTFITMLAEKEPFLRFSWGVWIALLAAIGAAGLAVMQNLAAIQALLVAAKAQQQNTPPPPPQNPPSPPAQ